MADKQIGIKLDVKSTGLNQIDDALDTISKNLKGLNESVLKEQKRGWGSESQTKELREQLRHMEQLTRLYERMARTQGVHSDNFGNFKTEISRMQGDLHSVPQYSTGRVGGWIQQRYGEKAAQSVDKLTDAIGKLGSLYAGFNVISNLHSGMERGTQLAYGFGDISKRLGVQGSALSYGRDTLKALQGYGYDDTSILQSMTQYQGITGRIDPKSLQSQMQAIESTGRRYGWDLGSTTQIFGNAYQNGVTGGSGSQMNPQEFATLVANATVQAHMQGRESQMVNQLAQVTQMTMQSMGGAGDQKTISAFLAMGDKTGNQALIQNLPNMINGINQGIMSPGGGYGGQALMMRAIGGGKMGFWQEQYQQSLGAFGVNPNNGRTNLENATDYLMQSFGGGDPYRQYSMLGQMFNLNPAQAKQFIDTYTKGGKFKSDALNSLRGQMDKKAPDVPQNDVDGYRNGNMNKDFGYDHAGMDALPFTSELNNIQGNIFGSPIGDALIFGSAGAAAAGVLGKGYKWLSPFLKGRKGVGSPPISGNPTAPTIETPKILGPDGNPLTSTAESTAKTGGILSKLGGVGKWLGRFGELGAVLEAGDLGKKLGDWTADKVFGSHYDPDKKITTDQESGAQSSTSGTNPNAGQELAPIVVSTIVALAPYMGQLKSLLGSDTAKPTSYLQNANGQFNASLPSAQANSWKDAIKFIGYNPSATKQQNPLSPFLPNGDPITGLPTVGAKDIPSTVSRYLPQIQSSASKYGIGDQVGLLQAIMAQESGGRGTDVMQMEQGAYGSQAGTVDGSIDGGIHEFADDLKKSQSMGLGMQEALGAYNMGPGILNYFKQNGGYSLHNMMEFSKQHGGYGSGEGNWHGYGDPWYVNHVMRYTKGGGQNLSGSVNVVLKYPDGSQQSVPAPISANYHGLEV